MSVIYHPKGAALEYSPLAANIFTTCAHGCKYCYSPSCLQKTEGEFFIEAPPRRNFLHSLENDCKRMTGDRRTVLLCFICDPYQPHEKEFAVTRQSLEILEKHHMNVQILTKGGIRAVRDFDILKRNDWKFGSTICSLKESFSRGWEPNAAPVYERVSALKYAHTMGIYTWVSVEPVIHPEDALHLIEALSDYVDFWDIGKLNHFREVELKIDWSKFLNDMRLLLKGKPHYIKKSLMAWENKATTL